MATDKDSAIARLKRYTGQASLGNAAARIPFMTPALKRSLGITPAVEAHIKGTSAVRSSALSHYQPGYAPSDVAHNTSQASYQPNSKAGSSLASWPATTFNNNPGNSLASWPAGVQGGTAAQASIKPYGYNDKDRGSDPSRLGFLPGEPNPFGLNDKDRGSDPMRQPVTPHKQPLWDDWYQDDSGATKMPGLVTKMPSVAMPNLPNISIGWHDFTPQAKARVASAYAPLYTALAGAKTNATNQTHTAQASVKGMYDAMNASTEHDKAASRAATTNQVNAAKALGASQTAVVNDAYDSSAKELAQLLASTGMTQAQGTVAGDTLASQLGHKADAQIAANAAAAENQANARAQGESQTSYITNMQNADRAQSISDRQTLESQLGNVLQQYDQQGLSTRADEAQQGLALNQQMGQNDFGAQQASANQANQQFNEAMQRASFQQNANMQQIGLQNAGILNEQQQISSAAAARQAAYNAQLGYNADIYKANTGLTEAQIAAGTAQGRQESDNANSAADRASRERIAAGNYQDSPYSPAGINARNPQTILQNGYLGIANGNYDLANSLNKYINTEYQRYKASNGDKSISWVDFLAQARDNAIAHGLDPNVAARAAAQFQYSNNNPYLLQNPGGSANSTYGSTNPNG